KPTALVPGCGKGHDALLLAALGYDVLALDFSETAIAQAKENQRAVEAGEAAGADGDVIDIRSVRRAEPGNVTWVSGDFFDDSWLGQWEGEKFDLIFDYTFPSGKPLSLPGPPWGLTPDIYRALLARPGDALEFSSPDVVIVPSRRDDGLERLALIKPARTHRAGMNEDGTVRDWIHVWGR
ncbi:thiol methyltransferase, partial [Colletotrichum musicola]